MRPGAYLHHIQLRSPDPARMARFYADTLDMKAQQLTDGTWLCEGPARLVSFCEGDAGLDRIGFACHDAESLAEFRRRVAVAGIAVEEPGTGMLGDGAFAVRDPHGNRVVFGLAPKRALTDPAPVERTLRGPLQHITLIARDIEAIEAFYADVLGFLISDRVMDGDHLTTSFLRSNHEHHTLACFRGSRDGVDHHSYEAAEWDTLRDWADHFARRDIQLSWGPGRHGPGNNLFIFIHDPDGNWIELSAELEVIHDRVTKSWPHHPRTLNLWGEARMRI